MVGGVGRGPKGLTAIAAAALWGAAAAVASVVLGPWEAPLLALADPGSIYPGCT